MISRIATALHKLPSEVRSMTLPQALDLFRYWEKEPPEHEALAIFLRIYTTFGKAKTTQADHQRSLEERWNAGALNPKQMFELFGAKPVQPAATMH